MRKNIEQIYRGDDVTIPLHFVDSVGDDVSIVGWKIYFTVKEYKNDSDDIALIKKDITEHTTPIEGKTKIVLTDVDTNNLNPGTNFYDIQVKKLDGTIKTYVSGKIDVLEDITRRTT